MIDFLIFTDQDYQSIYKNINVIHMDLNNISGLISHKLNLDVSIERPYKFCDFRPAYGVIFEDYIRQYDFWGHCDTDQVFGNIMDFLNDEILSKYDRVNHLGHFCLYKNNTLMNNLYKQDGAVFNYREVFLSNCNYAFDEITGIDMICKKNNISNYEIMDFADIDVKHRRYMLNNNINYKKQYFFYSDGKLYFKYYENDELKEKEIMYLHFQKKKPNIVIEDYDNSIYIGSIEYTDKENVQVNPEGNSVKEKFEVVFYYMKKVTDFFKCNKEQKKIWIKQKKRG